MYNNVFKFFFRKIAKNKAFFFINLTGLTLGFFTCILMLLYVKDELSYDRFNKNGQNIYRIVRDLHYSENVSITATSPGPYAPGLLDTYPGMIQHAVRLYRKHVAVRVENNTNIPEDLFFFSDQSLFDVFSYTLERGDISTALTEPFSLVLTKSTAKKYFGDDDPLGKALLIENKHEFKITGILDEIPRTSHIKFDFLASFSSVKPITGQDLDVKNYGNVWEPLMYTYVLIPDERNLADIMAGFPDFIGKTYGEWAREDISFILQPLFDIHLKSHLVGELEENSDIAYVYILTATALLVLIIACINFMNLSTSQSVKRAKEVGVKKVLGAFRIQLIRQFLFESTLFSFLALIAAIGFVLAALPAFSEFTGKEFALSTLINVEFILLLTGLTLITGLLSGGYLAFVLSSFQPIKVLKGITSTDTGGTMLRKSLIVFQFAVTIVFLIGTIVIRNQLEYVADKDLGMNKDYIISIPIRDTSPDGKYDMFKAALTSHPSVVSVTRTSHIPFNGKADEYVYGLSSTKEEDYPTMYMLSVDHDFVKTMKMRLVQGRDFREENTTDTMYGYIINEAAVKKLGLAEPVNTEFGRAPKVHGYTGIDRLGNIIGVVEDFHFTTLHSQIEPMAIFIHPQRIYPYKFFLVKLNSVDIRNTIEGLKVKWAEINPGRPFEFTFLDDYYQNLFTYDRKLSLAFRYFAFLAVVVACLGLFGMISFMTEQRVKEIGIRKTLGAGSSTIIGLLLRDIIKLVAVSNIIAWPAAYFASRTWLEQFAYRTDITAMAFIISGAAALLLAFITTGYKAAKAASANPVKSLKYE